MKIAVLLLAAGMAASAFGADMAYKGYLVDKACGMAGTSKMDGSDEINAPQEHTVACEVACAKSGYGLMVANGKTFKFVPFDAKGTELATQILKTTKKTKGPVVAVMGTMKKGAIAVSSLTEAEM